MTSDDRREVAERLRALPADIYNEMMRWRRDGIDTDGQDQTDYYLLHNVVMGCLPADNMHPCDYEEFHGLLADLIDPTCRMEPEGEGFRCSACGTHHDMSGFDEFPWPRCPECGARVKGSNSMPLGGEGR